MAMRSALGAMARSTLPSPAAIGGATVRSPRFFSDGKGKVLGEEERAAENIYIQKMEREKKEKLKRQQEKEKADENTKNEKK